MFTNHVLLYLDFLGVSAAATSWPDERAAKLIDVLQFVAAARAPFDLDGGSQLDGSYKFRVTAETSTFSDHIVASYFIPTDADFPIDLLMNMYVSLARDMASKVAVHALRVGLLVRGGLTVGKLYHAAGVVFGEAMIDAHQLESTVAIYPRIAVSPRVSEKLSETDRIRLLRKDPDEVWHLDYISNMPVAIPEAERQEWIVTIGKVLDYNIKSLEETGKARELSKWKWFTKEFQLLVRTDTSHKGNS